MKKIIFLLACSLFIVFAANAQQDSTAKKTKKEKVQNHFQHMDSTQKQNLKDKGITKENLKELGLTKDQQKQVDDIFANNKKEKDKVRNDASLTEDQKKEKLKQLDKDAKSKINNILTPEQREKIKKKKENNKPE
jgi:Spy/CpxP family protein refolding chaperone